MLTLLCISGFVYFGLVFILLFVLLLFSGWATSILVDYYPDNDISLTRVVITGSLVALLHATAFIGIFYLWKLKKTGYYIIMITTLLIIILPYLFGFGNWQSTLIYIVFIILLSLFFKKLS
ncbi:MAG: hypothetical protein K8S16_19755 [Bacteroidales bacterium]|nr:hypothetical protein [Bacteroidales bacterium]